MSVRARGMGRIATADPDDARFPLRALLRPEAAVPDQRTWHVGPILDQGQTPMCVGYATRQWLTSSPVPDKGGPSAPAIYHGAQANDSTPGEGYDGTDDRGAMKFLQSLGYVGPYHWTATADEAATYVLTTGGVLIGVAMYAGMEEAAGGVMRLTGDILGGHEMFVAGYNRKRGLFRVVNSWGTGWAERGRAWLSGEDLQHLLATGGDCCAPVQTAPPRRG